MWYIFVPWTIIHTYINSGFSYMIRKDNVLEIEFNCTYRQDMSVKCREIKSAFKLVCGLSDRPKSFFTVSASSAIFNKQVLQTSRGFLHKVTPSPIPTPPCHLWRYSNTRGINYIREQYELCQCTWSFSSPSWTWSL